MKAAELLPLLDERRRVESRFAHFWNRIALSVPTEVSFTAGRKRPPARYAGWVVASDSSADRHIALAESPWVRAPEWFVLDGISLSRKRLEHCPSFPSLTALLEHVFAVNGPGGLPADFLEGDADP